MNIEFINNKGVLFLSEDRTPYMIDIANNSFYVIFINRDSQIKIIGRNVHYPNSAIKMNIY